MDSTRVGPWPFLQTFYKAGNPCHGQTLVNYDRKKFYNIGYRKLRTGKRSDDASGSYDDVTEDDEVIQLLICTKIS
jgi:hypothetical protein